jgi:hypothetical protein
MGLVMLRAAELAPSPGSCVSRKAKIYPGGQTGTVSEL